MKLIKYLFIMVVAIMVSVSCNDDDDENDGDVNALLGSWELTEMEDGEEYTNTITFKENLTGILAGSSTFEGETETYSETFTWSTNNNKLTVIIDGETIILTYAISGNKLTITEDGDINIEIYTRL